ncbi:MAG TPA: heme exporter protein CcmD [Stellaceae bacterium]|nr:heme exporter protein CcmD [Stellaceae bacterium]
MTTAVMSYLAMGGYAAYVWPAYGVTLLVLGGLTLWCVGAYRRRRRELERQQRESGR